MTCNQCYLFDCEPSFEQAARAFVPQIMKMKVVDIQVTATSTEGCADRPMIERENSIVVIAALSPLLFNDGPRIVPGGCEERYSLVVTALVSRVLPVADKQHPRARFQIGPTRLADLFLAHGRCDGELNDLANRCNLARVCVEMTNQLVEFILCRPSVALLAFPNKAKPLQGDTGEINLLNLDGQAVHCSGMRQNELYEADVDAESHRSGALGCPVTTKTNEAFTIESRDVALPQMSLKHIEGGGLGAARGLAYIAHVVDMKVNKFAEGFQARYTGLGRRLAAINLALGFGRPAPCVVSAQEGLADVATFATDLDAPGTGRELGVSGHFFVCAPCALRDRNVAKRVVFWRKFVCTRHHLRI